MVLLWHPATDAYYDSDDGAAHHHHQSGWLPAADREAYLADVLTRAEVLTAKPKPKTSTDGSA